MKMTLKTVCFIAIFFLAMPMAFAETSTQTLPNVRLEIPTTNVPTAGGNPFTFDTSPNVSMEIVTSGVAYAITCTNTLTNTEVGNEYGTNHSATGYAQRQKTVAAGEMVPAPASELETFAGWTWMGGGETTTP